MYNALNYTYHRITSSCNRGMLILSILFFQCFLLPAGAFAQNKRLNINLTNAPIKELFDVIKNQTEMTVVYNVNDVDLNYKISIKATNEEVKSVLNKVLKETEIIYTIQNNHIVLSSKKALKNKVKLENPSDSNKKQVKGFVFDEKGEALIGVSVVVEGTKNATMSSVDGSFILQVQKGDLLNVSYIGYLAKSIPFNNESVLNVVLKENSVMLNDVVVTAMGIERTSKSLTYSTQTVGGRELTRTKETNLINSLQGKSAGLSIIPNSSGAGGSSKVLLRGNSSVLGANSPLIVLDGIPMSNPTKQIGSEIIYGGGSDSGDALSNLNPDDILSITVLKGPNAAALYGSLANNGVLVITTKSGAAGKTRVDISSSTMFETPLLLPKLQNTYGGNITGNDVTGYNIEANNWGKKLSEFSADELSKVVYASNKVQNNLLDYFKLGTTFNNSISVSGGSEKSQAYFSYGNTRSAGICPENTFGRHNMMFKENISLFNNKLKLNFTANFIIQNVKNRPGSGEYANPLFSLYTAPRNADMQYFKSNYEVVGTLINKLNGKEYVNQPLQVWPWSTENSNNPYWIANRMQNESKRERTYVAAGADLSISPEISAKARISYDLSNNGSTNKRYATTRGKTVTYMGEYMINSDKYEQLFADFLGTYQKKEGDIEFNANVGASITSERTYSMFTDCRGDTLVSFPNDFIAQNMTHGKGASVAENFSKNWFGSVYATTQLGYKEKFYIDLSARNDWAYAFKQFKDLGTPQNFIYYSAGANVLLDECFKLPDMIDRLKLRASYSEVGNSIPAILYMRKPKDYKTGGLGSGSYESFDDVKPETTRSTELGVELALLHNALNFDLTLYNSEMHNQYLTIPGKTGLPKPVNTGVIRNRGIEFTGNYTKEIMQNFTWKTGLNFSYNENKIIKLDPRVNALSAGSGLEIRFTEGKAYGELYGNTFKTDKSGNIEIAPSGKPKITTDRKSMEYLGNANAKINFGWNNTLSYKNFSCYFLIDGKIGGTVVSMTEARLDMYGSSVRSAEARDAGKFINGSQSFDPKLYFEAIGSGNCALSEYAYDATNLRLREVSVGYSFRNIFGFSKDLSISAVARNLFFLYVKSPVDPDISVSTANGYSGIDMYAMPTTRSFGLNVKLNF